MTISLQNIGATHLATSSVRLEETNSSSTLPQNMTDDALITRCIANDRLAQRALYDRYTNRLYSVAMRYVRHAETAQDVLAEAWIKIFKNLSKFKHDGSFEGWMKRIVSNEALTASILPSFLLPSSHKNRLKFASPTVLNRPTYCVYSTHFPTAVALCSTSSNSKVLSTERLRKNSASASTRAKVSSF